MMRKSFSVVLAVSIVLIVFTQGLSFALDKKAPNTSNIREAKILSALQIIDGIDEASYNPEGKITRAEFAVYITKMLGVYDNVKELKYKLPFSDVKADYWAAPSIAVGTGLGIISGYSNNTFRPEETVTYEQAVKFILSTLGYDVYAQQRGGYPFGYMSLASEKGILKNVNVEGGLAIQFSDAVMMLYNALEVEIVSRTEFGKDSSTYTTQKNKTLMSEKLHVYRSNGKFTATRITKLTGPSGLFNDDVMIDGLTYKNGKAMDEDLLGYKVNYYYKQETSSSDRVLLYAEPYLNGNETLYIKSSDIQSYHSRTYTYDDQTGRVKTAKISPEADILYNGKAKLDFNDTTFLPLSGGVMLIDNNTDGEFDVVKLTAYENCVAQSINAMDYTVYDKFSSNNKLVMDPNDKSVLYRLRNQEGKQVNIADIAVGDVLSYLKGEDTNGIYYDITVVKDTVEGSIAEIQASSNIEEIKVVINSREYGIAKGFYDNNGLPKIGDEGVFRFDINGNIASLDKTGLDYANYAFLIKVQSPKNSLDSRVTAKLFDSDGEFIHLYCSEKVEIDGETNIKTEDIVPMQPQVILYDLNSRGEIIRIDTASKGINEQNDSLRLQYDGRGGVKYKGSLLTFGAKFSLTPSTIIINIPEDREDDEGYSILTSRDFTSDLPYSVMAYTSKVDSPTANVILASNAGEARIDGDSPITIVEKVTRIVTEDGETVGKLYGNSEGKEIQAVTSSENIALLDDILPGDAIRYGLDSKKQISAVNVIYSPATGTYNLTSNPSSSDYIAFFRVVFGSVYSKTDGYIRVATDITKTTDNDLETYAADKFKIILCEVSGTKVKISTGTIDDIVEYKRSGTDCSKVLIQTRYGDPKAIYIFEKE